MKEDVVTLSQILERIERIEASGIDRERFLTNTWEQDALIRNLEIIGEAAKRLAARTRERAPGIRWSDFAGYRDVAIHAYDRLSLERTWAIVDRDLPNLRKAVRRLLRQSAKPSPP